MVGWRGGGRGGGVGAGVHEWWGKCGIALEMKLTGGGAWERGAHAIGVGMKRNLEMHEKGRVIYVYVFVKMHKDFKLKWI